MKSQNKVHGKQNQVAFFNILSTIILQGIGFFSAPIFSRVMGTSNYGIVSVYSTWVAVLTMLFSLGIYGTIGVARTRIEKNRQLEYQSSVLFLCTISYCLLSLISFCVLKVFLNHLINDWMLLFFAFIEGFEGCCINFANNKFIYEFKPKKNFFLSLYVSISSITLSLVLIKFFPYNVNYYGRILGLVVSKSLVAVIIWILVIKHGKCLFHAQYWRFCLPLSIPIALHNLSNLILSQSDKVMLQSMEDNDIVGIYSLAYGFGGILVTIYETLYKTWLPFYFEYSREKNQIKIFKHGRNYLQIFTIISLGFLYVYKEVYQIFASRDYWDGMILIPVFVMGFYFMFLYSFSVMYELYNKKTKFMAIATFMSAISNLILNFILINYIGILGAAFASSIAYFLEFLFHYIYACRCVKEEKYPFGFVFFAPYVIVMGIFSGLYVILYNHWIVRWIIASVLGIYLLAAIIKRRSIF